MKIKEQKIVDTATDVIFTIVKNSLGGMTLSYFTKGMEPFTTRTIQFGRNGRIEQKGTSMGIRRVI